ncbi:hypothetical protein P170DRAFT_9235 [Aspergillus steynii IBT 23096]|uniref:F-box domain-containing protein n=1 Tax=Aspergillus steynii IBT 23096 TaxID=1392250 RepID=A0A2I2GMS3_9EURO|nr:uncharacterized protein P170DRAFT_9235 [Aspergillus steynii IBT 23096]PLB54177.1 hypothetical protein P170DRAFT_9235 [Aspergillus steynii IBT 23096]
MNLSSLPHELIITIINHIHTSPTLVSLAQTNHFFNRLATPSLYTSPHIPAPGFKHFLSTIKANNHEPTIRHLSIRNIWGHTTGHNVGDSLSRLANLEALYLHGTEKFDWTWHDIDDTESIASLFLRMTLSTPVEDRVMSALRSCGFGTSPPSP